MADLIFSEHAYRRASQRDVPEELVQRIVEDADDVIEREDGRTDYVRTLADGRTVRVVIEADGVTVVTVIADKQRRPRRQ